RLYTLSLHDALPILRERLDDQHLETGRHPPRRRGVVLRQIVEHRLREPDEERLGNSVVGLRVVGVMIVLRFPRLRQIVQLEIERSEEHTSELQSLAY